MISVLSTVIRSHAKASLSSPMVLATHQARGLLEPAPSLCNDAALAPCLPSLFFRVETTTTQPWLFALSLATRRALETASALAVAEATVPCLSPPSLFFSSLVRGPGPHTSRYLGAGHDGSSCCLCFGSAGAIFLLGVEIHTRVSCPPSGAWGTDTLAIAAADPSFLPARQGGSQKGLSPPPRECGLKRAPSLLFGNLSPSL